MSGKPTEYAIQSAAVRRLSKLVEESTRATGESVKYFIEPTPGVLDKAKTNVTTSSSAGVDQESPAFYAKSLLI